MSVVYELDPLGDSRWAKLVEVHPRASAFHTVAWLQALRRTYGYEPFVLTTCTPGSVLTNGVVFCRIHSCLTGSRLVSLPFCDHCEPLVNDSEFQSIAGHVQSMCDLTEYKYIEIRGQTGRPPSDFGFEPSATFWLHKLNLGPSIEALWAGLHPSCIKRQIRRGERIPLSCDSGLSETLLAKFYDLHLGTRARHGVPPQPLEWFRNLMCEFGDRLRIWIALKDRKPVAGILTLSHQRKLIYKYAAADPSYHQLPGSVVLLWHVMQNAKSGGQLEFDLGRTDCNQLGLIAFKDRWGTQRSRLRYQRYPASATQVSLGRQLANAVIRHMPPGVLKVAGTVLYRHIG